MVDSGFEPLDAGRQGRLAQPLSNPATPRAVPSGPQGRWQSGGGGLTSTAADYARFCQMLLNGGELDGVQLLSAATVSRMMSNQLPQGIAIRNLSFPAGDVRPEAGQGFGLGGMVRTSDSLSKFPGSVGDYSWTGAFGTQFWIDPKQQMFAILMVQIPFTSFPTSIKYWNQSRTLVYRSLVN